MHNIFRPFVLSSFFHFSRIYLFRIKFRSNDLALCSITTILVSQGRSSHRSPTGSSQNVCLLLPHRRHSASFSTASHCAKTIARRRVQARVLSPCKITSYFASSRNNKTPRVPYLLSRVNSPAVATCSIGALPLFSLKISQNRLLLSWLSLLLSAPQVAQHIFVSQTDFFFVVFCLWFAKHACLLKCLLHSAQGILTEEKSHGGLAIQSLHVWSQMCVASFAHDLLHTIHKLTHHRASYIHDHVLVSFHFIIDYINSFRGVDLPFEQCFDTPGIHKRLSYSPEYVLEI